MSGLIPRNFIDDLLTRVDIVDTIHVRVGLKKKGQLYAACCPFHSEKTPSFMVNPVKQFYYCFGCGVSGTAISFMMAYEHLDFVEAVESLAASQGLSVPREKGRKAQAAALVQQKNKNLYTLMEDVTRYYQQHLQKNSAAQAYLEQRGLSRAVIERYSLGYIPEGWDGVRKQFSPPQSSSYTQQQLQDVGLLIENDKGSVYDRFRDRIMFPIVDRRGRTIGFGGRVMGEGSPKYLNSPETTIFHKGRELYGFYEARQHTRKLSRIVVVEGYMDVIALAQFDISYAVATLGTATTKEHVGYLFRAVSEVIFCFDGDRAGREAAWRALQNSLAVLRDGKDIRFLFLPMGEDPDSQVRKIGGEAFEISLQRDSISMTDYLIEHLSKLHNLSTREGRASFLAEAGGLLQTMPEGLIFDQLKMDIARLASIDVATFTKRKRKQARKPANTEPKNHFSRLNARTVRITPIRYAITLLLHRPTLVSEVGNSEEIVMFNLPGVILLAKLIETIEESPHINAAAILDRWRNTKHEASIVSLMQWQPESDDDVMLAREIKDCLRQIRKQAYGKKLEYLLQKERINGLDDLDKRDLLALLRECNHPERIE